LWPVTGFVGQQELLQRGGDPIALGWVQRPKERLVGCDDGLQGLLGKLLTSGGEPHPDAPSVCRVGGAPDEPGPFEAVQPRGHRAGGDK
jgi:hypothetical protein